MIIAKFVAVGIIGYLLGSIPFGLLIGKGMAKVDVREYGSGKIGTTNVLRAVGRKAAGLVVLGDVLKGTLAVIIAGLIFKEYYLLINGSSLWWLGRSAQVLAALAAVAGHNWPIFLKFRGGRGVATFFGGLSALSPMVAFFGGEMIVISVGLTRFASLGSISGAVATYAILVPLTLLSGFPIEYLVYTLIGTLTIIIMHRDNITRLIAGQERRLGEGAEKIGSSPIPQNRG